MNEVEIHSRLKISLDFDEDACFRIGIGEAFTWLNVEEVDRLHALCGRWVSALLDLRSERCQIQSDFTEAK